MSGLRLGGRSPSPVRAMLVERGASRELIDYLDRQRGNLRVVWTQCPRVVWLVELATFANAAPKLLVDALEYALETELWSEAMQDEELAIARAFVSNTVETQTFIDWTGKQASLYVERQPEVRAALAKVKNQYSRLTSAALLRASDEYDAIYASMHSELAAALRERIPFDMIRAGLLGTEVRPYR